MSLFQRLLAPPLLLVIDAAASTRWCRYRWTPAELLGGIVDLGLILDLQLRSLGVAIGLVHPSGIRRLGREPPREDSLR